MNGSVRRTATLFRLWPLILYLLLAIGIQWITGAWDAAFVTYPDEPSHFVSSVMVRDYIAHGLTQNPLSFAKEYYDHYPFFAVGYWPPLYYVMMGTWFLIAGVGRLQALLLVGVVASGCAWLICVLVRRRAGDAAGFCAGLLFLTLPEVQTWLCAVMVDQTVLFFSLAATLFTIRYFERPDWTNAIGFALCAAATVLTKYSGLFILGLPYLVLLLLRRFDLLRSRSFWAQPVLTCALVAPWVLWTAHLARVGLPAKAPQSGIVVRIIDFSRESLLIFPAVPLVFVIAGLVVLVMRPSAWRLDTTVTACYIVLLIGFLVVTPVDAERRYLQGAAAALLVLSFFGWWTFVEAAANRGAQWVKFAPILVIAAAVTISSLQVLRFRRIPDTAVPEVVRAVTRQPQWRGKRILVAPDMEGSMIAEFVARDPRRPGYWLRRPSKRFASLDWFGGHYSTRFSSASDVMKELRADPVDLVIWHRIPVSSQRPHEQQIEEVLKDSPAEWRPLASFGSWTIYQYIAAPRDN